MKRARGTPAQGAQVVLLAVAIEELRRLAEHDLGSHEAAAVEVLLLVGQEEDPIDTLGEELTAGDRPTYMASATKSMMLM